MRWLRVAGAVGALAVVAQVAQARVPSFVRMTGYTCNQCHMTWTPTPDFTFTGQKFRMNAYREPFIADKIEAGNEGALNGKRLVLGLQNYWTWHYRSNIVSQSKAASDPAVPSPAASAISGNMFGSVGIDYTGPIGEHFGLWTEYYVDGAGGVGNVRGSWTNAEYTMAWATNPGGPGNVLGFVWTNQELPNDMGFSPFRSGAPDHLSHITPAIGRIQPQNRLAHYGFIGNRFLYNFGVQTGEDNTDYRRLDYEGGFGYAFGNTDYKQGWLLLWWAAGNDIVPMISQNVYSWTNNSFSTRDAVQGISALHGGTSYNAANTGDFYRFEPELRLGAVDHGPHSIAWSIVPYFTERERYNDGSEATNSGGGVSLRYCWERTICGTPTYGWSNKYNFTDRFGVVHNIPIDANYNLLVTYRVAMNAAFEFAVGNAQALVLDQNYRNGWAWSFQWHFLF